MVIRATMLSLFAVSALSAGPLAGAQQLNQPKPVQMLDARDATAPRTNQLPPPQPSATGKVNADAGQRATTPPVSPKGPATDAQRPTQPSSVTPTAPATPARVFDAQGRLVPGAVQVGNNQVMDPKTGRIYPVTPAGDGLRIATPPKP